MLIKNLFHPWRQNVALHATLITKRILRIDNNTRDMVRIDNAQRSSADQDTSGSPADLGEQLICSKLKLVGITRDGIEIYIDVELIGPPRLLQQFQFAEGKHVGLVLRAID